MIDAAADVGSPGDVLGLTTAAQPASDTIAKAAAKNADT